MIFGWLSSKSACALDRRHSRGTCRRSRYDIIGVVYYPLCFRWLRFFVVALGLSSWWKDWACHRHYLFRGSTAGVRYGMICYRTVGVSAAVTPVGTRRGSRFIASMVAVDGSQCCDGLPRGRWPGESMPCKFGGILRSKLKSSRGRVFTWVLPEP